MKSKAIIGIIVAIAVVITGGITVKIIVAQAVNSPKKVIERFEQAYNDVNVSGMVECFEPTVQSFYNTADSLVSGYLGIGIEDMVNDVLFLAPLIEKYEGEDFLASKPELSIQIHKVEKNGNVATVYCTVSINTGKYGSESEERTIETVKIDGDWYISSEEIIGNLGF